MFNLEAKLNEISMNSVAEKENFEFLLGSWEVRNTTWFPDPDDPFSYNENKFTAELNVREILAGYGQIDRFITSKINASTLRIFDEKTKLWSLYWLTDKAPTISTPQIGTFENDFWGTMQINDQETVIKYVWKDTHTNIPTWEQYLSRDGESDWRRNWLMTFHKIEHIEF